MSRAPALLALVLLSLAPAQAQSREEAQRFREHYAAGEEAYQARDWEAAAAAFKAASEAVPEPSAAYNLACCYALAGKPELALDALALSIRHGFQDEEHMRQDPDLESIRGLPRFEEVVASLPKPDAPSETLELPGDAELPQVPFFVNVPDGHDPDRKTPYPIVLAFPPGPGTAPMVQAGLERYWREEGSKRGYLIVSVQIQGQRLSGRAAAVVSGVLETVESKYRGDLSRVVVAGFSNGGLGAFTALVETWPQRPFKGLVGIPGALPGGRSLEGLDCKDFPFLLMVGERDESWVPFVESTAAQLRELGAQVETETLSGQGHVIDVAPARLFDWIDGVFAEDGPEEPAPGDEPKRRQF